MKPHNNDKVVWYCHFCTGHLSGDSLGEMFKILEYNREVRIREESGNAYITSVQTPDTPETMKTITRSFGIPAAVHKHPSQVPSALPEKARIAIEKEKARIANEKTTK